MTPLNVLKKITEFTEKEIAPTILMQKELRRTGDVLKNVEPVVEYVHPAVTYGTIPHKNFQPLDFQCPMILWTFDEVADGKTYDEGRTIQVRGNVSAYSSELYGDERLPDNKAVVDLMNVLERIYIEFARRHVINGVGVKGEFSYGIYDGAYYPYAYGWISFTAEIPRVLYDDIDLDL